MATKSKAKGRKGKLGKNKSRIAAYYNSCRWEWNKMRRLRKHLLRHIDDKVATKAAKALVAAMPLHMSRKFNDLPLG